MKSSHAPFIKINVFIQNNNTNNTNEEQLFEKHLSPIIKIDYLNTLADQYQSSKSIQFSAPIQKAS